GGNVFQYDEARRNYIEYHNGFSGYTEDGNFVTGLDETIGQKSNRVLVEEGDGVLDSDGDGVHLSEKNDAIQQAGKVSPMASTSPQARNVSIANFFAEFDALKSQVLLIKKRKADEFDELTSRFSKFESSLTFVMFKILLQNDPASSSSHPRNDEVACHADDQITTIDVLVPPIDDDRLLCTMKPNVSCDQFDVDHFEDDYMLVLNDEKKPDKFSLDDMEMLEYIWNHNIQIESTLSIVEAHNQGFQGFMLALDHSLTNFPLHSTLNDLSLKPIGTCHEIWFGFSIKAKIHEVLEKRCLINVEVIESGDVVKNIFIKSFQQTLEAWFLASVEFIKGLAYQDGGGNVFQSDEARRNYIEHHNGFGGYTEDGNFVKGLDETIGQKNYFKMMLIPTQKEATDLNPEETEEIPNFCIDPKDTSSHTAGVSTDPMPTSSSSYPGNDEVACHADDRMEIDAENAKDEYTNSQRHLDLLIKACAFKTEITTIDVLVPHIDDDRLLRTMKPNVSCDQFDNNNPMMLVLKENFEVKVYEKPCVGPDFAPLTVKKKKCQHALRPNSVLRSVERRKKKLGMDLKPSFGQQSATTPAPKKQDL
nr:hypothetical protein [Tanacetum cinerariifolium]